MDPYTAHGADGVHGVPVLTPVEAQEHKLDHGASADTPLVGAMDVQDPRHRHRPVTGSVIMQPHHSPGTVRVRSRSGTDAATNVSQEHQLFILSQNIPTKLCLGTQLTCVDQPLLYLKILLLIVH